MLKTLRLSQNRIVSLPSAPGWMTKTLTTIQLDGNMLKDLNSFVRGLSSLKILLVHAMIDFLIP